MLLKDVTQLKTHRYVGKMSRDKREKAVRTFMRKNEAKVMLMSLKCGGVGLVSFVALQLRMCSYMMSCRT